MRRNCFSPVPGFLSLCLACITAGVPSVRAQISVGPVGVGPLTFDSAPAATEFSTGVLLGVGPTYSNLVSLNAGVASVDERIIVGTLTTTSEATPGTYAGGMRYNSQLRDAARVNATEAAIPLNSIQTLDVQPGPGNWATRNVGGLSGSIVSPEALDAAIQTNEVSTLNNALQITSGSTNSGLAQWNSIGRQIVMQPVGVAYNVLLATLQNTSGHDLASVAVGYDFGNPAPAPGAEDPGLNGWRAYYSLTGQAGTWLLIHEFSISQPGSPGAVIPLGSWAAGSLLYVLWADDNGSGSDSAFTIDNFIALESLPPPPPPRIEPPGTNVLCDGTIRFTAVAIGMGLSYRWYKDGQPIDPVSNPTATQATLIVTNAQFMDAGDYRVTVQNVAGSTWSDGATVLIACDPIPPRFVFAYDIPDNLRGFRLSVDKLLCTNEFLCGNDATRPYNWIIEKTSFSSFLEVESVTISGTNLEFTTVGPRVAGETYRIRPADDGTGISAISDLFGNRMPSWYSITSNPALLFRQGRNGYSGAQDTEIHAGNLADTVLGAAPQIHVDDDEGGVAQGLLRFDNVFGNGSGQIPIGARILSATLSLEQVDSGLPVTMHRMLIPWEQTLAAWNGFTDGIAADGIEARTTTDAVIASGASEAVDVTASLQAWADGEANYGWFLQSTGTDGFTFASSESGQPPSLTVVLRPPDPCIMYFTQHPASLTVTEGQSFTLSPRVGSAHCWPIYQWTKNGVDIPGATGQTYTVPMACISDAGVYRLRVASGSVSMTSNPAVVTVQDDMVHPVLTGAFGSLDGANITLTFSKVMNANNAQDTSHYSLDRSVTVTAAVLSPDGRTVTLTTAPRSPLTSYTLRIQDVTDNLAVCAGSIGNFISPNPTLVQLTSVRVDVPWNSEWLYSTNSQDATLSTPTPWYAPDFSPGPDWMTGRALFGTETSAGVVAQFPTPLLTPIPPNTNSPPDQITTYFRKQIELPALPSGATYTLWHFIDDGAVFYLDGVEIGRVNMTNAAPILFMNRAAAALEASVACFPFVASTGQHTLAVEVHQAGPTTSTDILFGAQLAAITEAPQLDIEPPIVSWNADSSWELLTSRNVAGPYAPVAASPFAALGVHYTAPTNPAAFYRLRYNGIAK